VRAFVIDQPTPDRGAALLDFIARVAAVLVAVWAAAEKVAKPTLEWRRRMHDERRKELAIEIREILKPELDRLEKVGLCTDRIELVLQRQSALFQDIDDFLHIAHTNVDRLDEVNELLNAVGFSSERRIDDAKRAQVADLLAALRDRQRARRRALDAERAQAPEEES
jgi:hypothetical protein